MDAPLPQNLTAEWQKFLADDESMFGLDCYDKVFDHGLLFPLQRRKETAKMIRLARSIQPQIVVEIGADKGASFYHWIRGLPTVKEAWAIEIRGVPYIDAFQEMFLGVKVRGIAESSYDRLVFNEFKDQVGGPIDCLFLDGDKGQFLTDFDLYYPLVRKGGLIFMHDIYPCGPNDPTVAAWKVIKKGGYKTSEIIDFSEVDEEVEREKASEPPKTSHAGWVRHWKRSSCGVGVVHK